MFLTKFRAINIKVSSSFALFKSLIKVMGWIFFTNLNDLDNHSRGTSVTRFT